LKGVAPERWLLFLLNRAGIDSNEVGANMPNEKVRVLAGLLKSFTMKVNGTQPIEKAFVTGGEFL
jgi:predicted flavoprotein YhiN